MLGRSLLVNASSRRTALCWGLWRGVLPLVSVTVIAAGCGGATSVVERPLATVSVPVVLRAAPPVVAEARGSRFSFTSLEHACSQADNTAGDPSGVWLVGGVCFDPEAFGSEPKHRGMWLLFPFAHDGDPTAETGSLSTDWAVLWVWSDGRVAEGPTFSTTNDIGTGNQSNTPEIGELLHLFDFDGDGIDELMLPVRQLQDATEGPRRLWVFTVTKAGEVATYPTVDGNVVWSYDYDSDGRPDLIVDPNDTYTDSEYPVHTSMETSGWQLAHSLPDGTFSTTDEVARHFVPE